MNVLHLVSQYKYTNVYQNIIKRLDDKGINQTIFICDRRYKEKFVAEKISKYSFNKFTKISSFLYYPKIKRAFNCLEKSVDLNSFDIIHAHTLFNDGGIALMAKKKYNIDYIVAVRKTDFHVILKKMPHAAFILNEIILNAKKVIFISPKTQEIILNKLNKETRNSLLEKIEIMPNGVDEFWLRNITHKKKLERPITFIQVSEFIYRKKIKETIKIIAYLKKQGMDVKLLLIGTGKYFKHYKKYCHKKKYDSFITFVGFVSSRKKLLNYYRKSDIFIMPSFAETFGLVYIEAMSQGLPIIYRKKTGVDGYFKENEVGFCIGRFTYKDIEKSIINVLNNYEQISYNALVNCRKFDWDNIVIKILEIYRVNLQNK